MQRVKGINLFPVTDCNGSRKTNFSWVSSNNEKRGYGYNIYLTTLWRKANKLEIIIYRKIRKPFDTSRIMKDFSFSIMPKNKSHELYGEKLILEDYIVDRDNNVKIYFIDQPGIFPIEDFNIQILK